MKKKSFYPRTAGELTEEERIAICKALYPEQANKAPENRALWPEDRPLTAAAALACGASRCALRLLEYPQALALSARLESPETL